jgi:hypothetical protein
MVCSQEGKSDPIYTVQQFPRSSGLPNISSGVEDEGLDSFIRRGFGNQISSFLKRFVGFV